MNVKRIALTVILLSIMIFNIGCSAIGASSKFSADISVKKEVTDKVGEYYSLSLYKSTKMAIEINNILADRRLTSEESDDYFNKYVDAVGVPSVDDIKDNDYYTKISDLTDKIRENLMHYNWENDRIEDDQYSKDKLKEDYAILDTYKNEIHTCVKTLLDNYFD